MRGRPPARPGSSRPARASGTTTAARTTGFRGCVGARVLRQADDRLAVGEEVHEQPLGRRVAGREVHPMSMPAQPARTDRSGRRCGEPRSTRRRGLPAAVDRQADELGWASHHRFVSCAWSGAGRSGQRRQQCRVTRQHRAADEFHGALEPLDAVGARTAGGARGVPPGRSPIRLQASRSRINAVSTRSRFIAGPTACRASPMVRVLRCGSARRPWSCPATSWPRS